MNRNLNPFLKWSHAPARETVNRLGTQLVATACVLMLLPNPGLAQSPPIITPVPAPASLPLDPSYTLGAGDRIRIEVFNVPEYSGEFLVLPDGTVNLPVIGSILVRGLTLQQASEAIAAQAIRVVRYPLITVSLVTIRPIKIAIAGEINRPGAYSISPASEREVAIPTVTRAIELAGGITQVADLRRVQIRRSSTPDRSQEEIITVNLWELLQTADLKQDLILKDGDSIVIPTLEAVNLDETAQVAAASFASNQARSLNIAVVGEVQRPGTYSLTSNRATNIPTVTRAIQEAGGITPEADIRSIQVRRPTKVGSDQFISINLWKLLQEGDLRQDIPLQDGDTIVIAEAIALTPEEATELASTTFSPGRIRINVIGEVIRPGTLEVVPNTPLNQGLLAAGGFNLDADKGSVELVRLNPNGTVSRNRVSVDFSRPLNEQNNPALRNNDTIIVRRNGLLRFTDSLRPIFQAIGTASSVFSIPSAVNSLRRLLDFNF